MHIQPLMWILLLPFLLLPPIAMAEPPPAGPFAEAAGPFAEAAGPFAEAECVACHPRTVADLGTGPHGRGGCIGCHGDRHGGAAARARRDEACLPCHGEATGPLGRSHLTSKHGVIVTLEAPRWDWTRPLSGAGYRAPSCAYCHLHEGRHGGSEPATACLDCHSPRFAETMAAAAERTLAIGRLKLREGEDVAASAPEVPDLAPLLTRLRASHAALRAGAAHHSPDIQWWHGQAALDGDLIRLKAAVTRFRREKATATPP
ncbi:MAG: hypothetical protein H7840_16115 [Alphaproteobacteria bacterium]